MVGCEQSFLVPGYGNRMCGCMCGCMRRDFSVRALAQCMCVLLKHGVLLALDCCVC